MLAHLNFFIIKSLLSYRRRFWWKSNIRSRIINSSYTCSNNSSSNV